MSSNCNYEAAGQSRRLLLIWLAVSLMIMAGTGADGQQKTYEMELTLTAGMVEGSPQFSGRLTYRGRPVSKATVRISYVIHFKKDHASYHDVFTDEDGRFSFTFAPYLSYSGQPVDAEATSEVYDDSARKWVSGYAKYRWQASEVPLSIDIMTGRDTYRTYDHVIVQGSVTSNGQPVEGAAVKFAMQKPSGLPETLSAKRTDARGYFTLSIRMVPEVYPSGGYTITATAEKEGYRPATKEANFSLLGNDLKLTFDAHYDPCRPWLFYCRGQVTAGGLGVPYVNINIVIKHLLASRIPHELPEESEEFKCRADEQGSFESQRLLGLDFNEILYPYKIEATASKEGFVSAKAYKTLRLDEVRRASITASTDKSAYRLGEKITVLGRVTCDNNPLKEDRLRIRVFGPDGGIISELGFNWTDMNGQFVIRGLRFGPGSALGRYTIQVEAQQQLSGLPGPVIMSGAATFKIPIIIQE